jgi:hypothetical protein
MKYLLHIFTALILISTVFAAAGDDIILRTSDINNAHAALWDETGYTTQVVWPGAVPADPHPTCDVDNTILKLSGAINAHVSQESDLTYSTRVCYGDLSCGLREGCDPGETCIGSMSDYTNAHFSTSCSDGGGYAIDVCCVEGCVNTDMLCGDWIKDEISGQTLELTQCVEDGTIACCDPNSCVFAGACYADEEIEQIDGMYNWECTSEHWCPEDYVYNPALQRCEHGQEACYTPEDLGDPLSLEYCNFLYPNDEWWTDLTGNDPCIKPELSFPNIYNESCCLINVLQGIDFFLYQDIEPTNNVDPTYIDSVTICGDEYACGVSDGVCPSTYADCTPCYEEDIDCCGECGIECNPVCGNNVINLAHGEECDNNEIPFTDCVDANPGFTSGDLSCNACQIDYSDCQGSPGSCPLTCTDFGFTGGTITCTLPDCSDCDTTTCIGGNPEDTCGNIVGEEMQYEYDSDIQTFDDASVEDCYNSLPINTEHVIDEESSDRCLTDTTLCVDEYTTYTSIIDINDPTELCVVDASCKDADGEDGDFEVCDSGNWHDPDESEEYCTKVGKIWDPNCVIGCGLDDYNNDPSDGYCADDDGSLITGYVLGEGYRGEGLYNAITEVEVTVSLKDMSLTTIYSTTADATGYYELEALSNTYYIIAEAETYVTYSDIIVISGPDTIPEIDMDMSTECNSGCTKNDNICYADCDGINTCEYPTGYMYENEEGITVKELCDQQGEWPVNLGFINPLEPEIEYEYFCCSGESVPTATAEIITTPGGEAVSITSYCRIVQIGGKPGSICVAVKD